MSGPNADGGANFTQITAGSNHTCGLRNDGSYICWGDDDVGQVSGPNADGGMDFAQFAAGYRHTCGLRTDGSYICWGDRFIDTRALVVASQ